MTQVFPIPTLQNLPLIRKRRLGEIPGDEDSSEMITYGGVRHEMHIHKVG